jgi:hypothetical protein
MAVLTNRGILISALNAYSNPSVSDLLVIQDVTNNQTKKITVSDFITGALNNVSGDVNLTSQNNKFTGSFYVPNTKNLKVFGTTALGIKVNGNIESAALFVSSSLTQGQVIRGRANTIDMSANSIALSAAGITNAEVFIEAEQINIFGPSYFDQTITANSAVITNLTSTVTGNFFGGLYGDVYSATGLKILENGAGPVKDATFTGTSSYASRAKSSSHAKVADTSYVCVTTATSADTATSASYSLSGSFTQRARSSSYLTYSPNNGSASYAIFAATAENVLNLPTLVSSASYALKSSTTDEVDGTGLGNGSGSFNIAFFSQSRVVSNVGLRRITNGNGAGNYQLLEISSSRYLNGIQISSRGSGGQNQSLIAFYNLNNSKSYPNISGYSIGSFTSGSLIFVAPIGSAEFSSSTRVAVGSAQQTYGLVSRRSGYYFWPYLSANTPSREGSIGIGFQPPTSADTDSTLPGKFSVRCFSSSKAHVGKVTGQALTGTVKLPEYAIYVDYGSSSYAPIFSVGASGSNAGDVYVGGDMTVAGTLNATLGYGTKTANAFAVRYPLGAITYGDYIFYCQANFTNTGYFFRLNQVTNEVTKIFDGNNTFSPARQFYAGHMALHKFDNNGVTGDYIVVTDSSYIYAIGALTSGTPTITEFSTGGGNFYQFKCAYVDASSGLPGTGAGTPTRPTFYLLPDSYQAGGNGANAITMYKVYWNGSAYTYATVGTALDILNNSLVLGNSNLVSINGTINYNTITNIYNPVKRRWYCINNNSGMCDIFNISAYSSNDIGAWWAQAAATRDPQLQYVKTIVIPQQGSNYWTDSNWESYGLEYDTTTGQEKFWTWNRVNNSLLTGIVGKSPYYGS